MDLIKSWVSTRKNSWSEFPKLAKAIFLLDIFLLLLVLSYLFQNLWDGAKFCALLALGVLADIYFYRRQMSGEKPSSRFLAFFYIGLLGLGVFPRSQDFRNEKKHHPVIVAFWCLGLLTLVLITCYFHFHRS